MMTYIYEKDIKIYEHWFETLADASNYKEALKNAGIDSSRLEIKPVENGKYYHYKLQVKELLINSLARVGA